MKQLFGLALAITISIAPLGAQSLKPESPAALQPGINKGTVDNMVGTHYWYFTGLTGQTHLHAQFKSMGLLGNPYNCTITITLSDAEKTWNTPKTLMSDGKTVDCTFSGELKKPTKLIVAVAPPPNGLVRTGGDYQLEASGAVSFASESNVDPVIGMYKQMAGYTSLLGDCKFQPDGTIVTTSGTGGKWQVFDRDSKTYVIDIAGQDRHSLQLVPGRGLCENDTIIFQQMK